MNTQANTASIVPRAIPTTQLLYWSIRRELMEYRSIYIAPASIAAVIILGFGFVLVHLPQSVRDAIALNADKQHEAILQPFEVVAGLIMAAAFIVSFYYALDSLYGERRDRSILFWKSLPVSDLTTVLAKAFVLLLVLPAVALVVTLVTEVIVLSLSMAVLATHGLNVAGFWAELQPVEMWNGLLYHIVTVHILWYAPMYCWLMLISAWSKRAPLLWALLPPFAIGVFEKVAFHTAYFQKFLESRLSGGNGAMVDPEMRMPIVHFIITPGLWYGLLLAAAFLLAAARLRRARGPI